MPAYSFKEQFVPLIKKRLKRQTIRGKRKHQAKPGDPLYLFYAMRTKYCTRILDTVCIDRKDIYIGKREAVYINGKRLNRSEKIRLAIKDGFRCSKDHPGLNPFDIMMMFWAKNNQLPFKGDIIYW